MDAPDIEIRPTEISGEVVALLYDLNRAIKLTRQELEQLRATQVPGGNGKGRTLDVLMRILIGVMTAGVIGAHAFLWRLNERVVRIEESRFTAEMGRAMESRLLEAMPPIWMRDDLVDHENRIRDLERRRTGGGGTVPNGQGGET
jgi:hypothetical protein